MPPMPMPHLHLRGRPMSAAHCIRLPTVPFHARRLVAWSPVHSTTHMSMCLMTRRIRSPRSTHCHRHPPPPRLPLLLAALCVDAPLHPDRRDMTSLGLGTI
jgi:hypothetical protein